MLRIINLESLDLWGDRDISRKEINLLKGTVGFHRLEYFISSNFTVLSVACSGVPEEETSVITRKALSRYRKTAALQMGRQAGVVK